MSYLARIVLPSRDFNIFRHTLSQLLSLPNAPPAACLSDLSISLSSPNSTTHHQTILSSAKSLGLTHTLPITIIDATIAGLSLTSKSTLDQNILLIEATQGRMLIHSTYAPYFTYHAARYPTGREGAAMMGWDVQSFVRSRRTQFARSKRLLVVLTGRGNSRPEVRSAVSDSLRDLFDNVQVLVSGTEYLTARGAAELAGRSRLGDLDENIEL
jgi:hypothetical protein